MRPDFDATPLVPAVVQDARTGEVRMVGYMNREAYEKTLETRWLHFFSRSRGRLWMKGETSGNRHRVTAVSGDCDGDALLVQAVPEGPTCHTGEPSCFFEPVLGPEGAGGLDGFRGHVGIRLRGREKSVWYPVTSAEWRRTDNHLANADPGEPWACIRSCNNRLVAVNLAAVERICLLDRACARPEGDWDVERLGESGRPFEFYTGLLNYFFDPEALAATASDAFRATLRDFVRQHGFTVEDAERLLLQTHLHRTSGEVVSLLADTACLVEFVTRAEQGLGRTVRLAEADGRVCFYPADGIGLVDMPLTLVHERYLSERDAA